MTGKPLRCRLFGCAWRFAARDAEIVWVCGRGCGSGGRRACESPEVARRRARILNRGRPGPPVGLLAALGGTLADRREPR